MKRNVRWLAVISQPPTPKNTHPHPRTHTHGVHELQLLLKAFACHSFALCAPVLALSTPLEAIPHIYMVYIRMERTFERFQLAHI